MFWPHDGRGINHVRLDAQRPIRNMLRHLVVTIVKDDRDDLAVLGDPYVRRGRRWAKDQRQHQQREAGK